MATTMTTFNDDDMAEAVAEHLVNHVCVAQDQWGQEVDQIIEFTEAAGPKVSLVLDNGQRFTVTVSEEG